MTSLAVSDRGGALRFEVHAKPKASRSRLVGVTDGALAVALAAPPVDGAANRELVKLLARVLGVSRTCVTIVKGESGRHKLVDVTGITHADLVAKIAAETS